MIQLQFINYILDKCDKSIIFQNNLSDEFFSDYKDEFNFIKQHLDKYDKVPDKATFLSVFPNFDIVEVDESSSFLLDKLREDYDMRKVSKTINDVISLSAKNKNSDALDYFINTAEELRKSTQVNCVDLLKDKSRYGSYIDRCNDYMNFYVKTGFPELDEVIGGWDRKEELVTIAARTNVGKSWVALKCAIAAVEQGLNVGIYSGEMSDRKVGYRIDTLISHISNSGITRGNATLQNEYKVYLDNLENKYSGSLKVLTPKMIGGPASVSTLRAFIEKEKLDMLIVDQHSLLEDDKHGKSPVEKAANISKDLKNLQVLEQIPIIAVSQQNRTSTENGVGTEHIAQSDRIAQDSTVILFFEKKDDDIMVLNLVKSRDSVNSKKFEYLVDFDKGIWAYKPSEDNENDVEKCEELRKKYEGDDEY